VALILNNGHCFNVCILRFRYQIGCLLYKIVCNSFLSHYSEWVSVTIFKCHFMASAKTKTRLWTWFWASSTHVQSSQPLLLTHFNNIIIIIIIIIIIFLSV
jgi:hypothetical protein